MLSRFQPNNPNTLNILSLIYLVMPADDTELSGYSLAHGRVESGNRGKTAKALALTVLQH